MSERLTKIQNRVERASEVLSAVFGEDSIAVMVGEDGGAVVFPKGLSAYAALLINAREDLEHLLIENAALRTRVEQAERERDEAKEVFALALREKGWAKALADAYAERDNLRAEVVKLREAF